MMKPSETLYAGMLIVRSPGKKMVISSSAIAVVVTKSICERVDTFPLMIELEKVMDSELIWEGEETDGI